MAIDKGDAKEAMSTVVLRDAAGNVVMDKGEVKDDQKPAPRVPPTPRCKTRNCQHYSGLRLMESGQSGRSEYEPVCRAFPGGIPDQIAYGVNDHLKPFPGDHGIQFEQAKEA